MPTRSQNRPDSWPTAESARPLPGKGRAPTGTAGENQRRRRQSEPLSRRLAIIADFSAASLAEDDPDALLQRAVTDAAGGLRAARAQVLEYRGATDDLLLRAGIGWADGLVGRTVLPADLTSPAGRCLRTGRPVVVAALPGNGTFAHLDLQRAHGTAALLTVPIPTSGLTYGVLEVDANDARRFSRLDIDFLQAIAAVLAGAIDRRLARRGAAAAQEKTVEIIESISAAYYALDHEWRFAYVNRQAETLLGRRREELLGKYIWSMHPPMLGSEFHTAHLRAAAERRRIELDAFSETLGRWIGMTVYPSTAGLSVYFRDITDRKTAEEALRASEERFRGTFEQAAVGISHVGLDGRWLRVNQRLCEILGYSQDELLQKSFQELTYPDDLDADFSNNDRLLSGDAWMCVWEKRYIRKDGQLVWIRLTVSLVRDEDGGGSRYFICVAEDIDQQKQAARALRESQERLRAALTASGTGTYRRELHSRAVDRDDSLCRLYGLAPDQTRGDVDEWLECIHPEDRAAIAAAAEQCVRERGQLEVDYRVVLPDGTVRWLAERGKTIFDETGIPIYVTGAAIDITERKRTEERLRERDERLHLALLAASIATYRWDLRHNRLQENDSIERLLGLLPGETIDCIEEFLQYVHPEDRAVVAAASEQSVIAGLDFKMDYRVVRRDGAVRWLADRGKVVRDRNGKPLSMTGACADITERKHAEERQRMLMAELNHRVKNTLAVVQAIASQTLKSASSPNVFPSLMGRLRALAAAHDLLTRNHWESADLQAIVEEALQAHDSGGQMFEIHGPRVGLSPKQTLTLSLALHELATNAVKYGALSTEAGRVKVHWRISDEHGGRRLKLSWTEQGGPIVAAPDNQGFGTNLIRNSIAYELRGTVDLAFLPEGLRCDIAMPWNEQTSKNAYLRLGSSAAT